jgi:hypothetical protein
LIGSMRCHCGERSDQAITRALDCFAPLAMTSKGIRMTQDTKTAAPGMLSLEDWQHWTLVMGRAQQMVMEAWADGLKTGNSAAAQPPGWGVFPPAFFPPARGESPQAAAANPMALMAAGADAWAKGLETWGRMVGLDPAAQKDAKDRRFAAPEWRENPVFDTIRQTYLALADNPEQAGRIRGRQEPGDHTRQGGQGNAALPADSIYADDRRGARDAAGDLPALDQPLLHPRPHP